MIQLTIRVIIVIICIALIVFGPLISIWALNLLFGLTIPYTLATWFAVLWLSGSGAAASRARK